jgi:hypothetical protein
MSQISERVVQGIPIDNFICYPDRFYPNHGFVIPLAEPDTTEQQDDLEQLYGNQVAIDSGPYIEACNEYLEDTGEQQQWEVCDIADCQDTNALYENTEGEYIPVYNSLEDGRVLDSSSMETRETRNSEELHEAAYLQREDFYSTRVFDSSVSIPPPASVVFAGSIYDSP